MGVVQKSGIYCSTGNIAVSFCYPSEKKLLIFEITNNYLYTFMFTTATCTS